MITIIAGSSLVFFKKTSESHVIENISSFSNFYSANNLSISVSSVTNFVSFESNISNLIENAVNFCRAYKYYTLAELTLEDIAEKERFLADYHAIKFLAEKSYLSSVDAVRLLTQLSNLLRLMSENKVDEIHLFTMRVIRKYSEILQKDIFFITEY
jgi:hypothetical protein